MITAIEAWLSVSTPLVRNGSATPYAAGSQTWAAVVREWLKRTEAWSCAHARRWFESNLPPALQPEAPRLVLET